ncbi:1-hydroxycarotenoid 3,4-desaturase CrtD [Pelagibius sp.]|uniref:1-hydroxycarotenoid 3,4-desaturase CrtD n=1 Tax=Pelagibius sp. TaxID=1931238 RepID=UPI0026361EA9|nr:1-hydroxycarotenoid 3,4-desaturase CrtD [Pelagibius sp.]
MQRDRVIIIGAGIAGLVAAVELAGRGLQVTLLERAGAPGGKMREVMVGPAADRRAVDAGPTVFTMRWVFDEIFARAGTSLEDHVTLQPVEVLARHAWSADERLDLFADMARSAEAIGDFSGAAEARRFLAFCKEAAEVYTTLEASFMQTQRPSPVGLLRNVGWRGLGGLLRIKPFETLWSALGQHFHDPRLRQLFGRYATYCGSSPFAAPATLMLVAHVEQRGVWLVAGGMQRLAETLAALSEKLGATIRYGTEVRDVKTAGGSVSGVELTSGEVLSADAVIVNADAAAAAAGLLGRDVAAALPAAHPSGRSLSAITWALAAETEGFPLLRHNVFFSGDYAAEFSDISEHQRVPRMPTVYVCAQDRGDPGDPQPQGPERLLCLINAPAYGDASPAGAPFDGPLDAPLDAKEIESCAQRTFDRIERCGLRIERQSAAMAVSTPQDFNRLFPGSGGALYGRASHGWQAAFNRPGARTRLPGLYLAGGSVHPGPGVPMAATSGRLAAESLLQDLDLQSTSLPAAMPGGISML